MGSEDACAAVHQRIVYKSGSVHIDTVPVQHWAQSERRPSSETAVSAVAAGGAAASDGADADDVEVVAASASSTSTSHVSVSSSLLLTSFSCAVGRLSAMQKFVPTVHARCKLVDTSFDALVIQRRRLLCSSYLAAVCQPVIVSYIVLAQFSQMLQSRNVKKFGWETLTRRRNAV